MVLHLATRRRNYRCRCKIVGDKFLWQDWFKGKWGKYEHRSIKENQWHSIDLSDMDQYSKVSYTFWNDAGGNHNDPRCQELVGVHHHDRGHRRGQASIFVSIPLLPTIGLLRLAVDPLDPSSSAMIATVP